MNAFLGMVIFGCLVALPLAMSTPLSQCTSQINTTGRGMVLSTILNVDAPECCLACSSLDACTAASFYGSQTSSECILFASLTSHATFEGSMLLRPTLPGVNDTAAMQQFTASMISSCGDTSWSSNNVCTWRGVSCRSDGSVEAFDWSFKNCSGTLNFPAAPKGLRRILLNNNNLSGPLDLTQLPPSLEQLDLSNNILSSSIDLTLLPMHLTELFVCSNQLYGGVDLTKLPSSLQILFLYGNGFTGALDLAQLPDGLQQLYLNYCGFTGPVDLTHLPSALQQLDLSVNQLSGPMNLTQLPKGIQVIYLFSNQFSGAVDLTQLPPNLADIFLNDNKLTGSVDLTKLPVFAEWLLLNKNQLSGALNLAMAEGIEYLYLNENEFSGQIDLSRLPPSIQVMDLSSLPDLCGNTTIAHGTCADFQLPKQCECSDVGVAVSCPPCV